MEWGLGVLHLSSREFWDETTLPELVAALDGLRKFNTPPEEREQEAENLTNEERKDIRALMKKHETAADTPANRKKLLARVKQMAAEKKAAKHKKR